MRDEDEGRTRGGTRCRPIFTRSERHYDIWSERALVHDDSDDLGLQFLADFQLDLDPVRPVLQLEGIARAAKFGVELERRAWRCSGYRLQRRILDGPDSEDSELL